MTSRRGLATLALALVAAVGAAVAVGITIGRSDRSESPSPGWWCGRLGGCMRDRAGCETLAGILPPGKPQVCERQDIAFCGMDPFSKRAGLLCSGTLDDCAGSDGETCMGVR